MKTNTVVLNSKANALRKERKERLGRVKLARANFTLKLSLFLNLIIVISLDALDFPQFSVVSKILSLIVLSCTIGLSLASFNEVGKLSKN